MVSYQRLGEMLEAFELVPIFFNPKSCYQCVLLILCPMLHLLLCFVVRQNCYFHHIIIISNIIFLFFFVGINSSLTKFPYFILQNVIEVMFHKYLYYFFHSLSSVQWSSIAVLNKDLMRNSLVSWPRLVTCKLYKLFGFSSLRFESLLDYFSIRDLTAEVL